MPTKKPVDFIARFRAIYSASKTEEYLFKKRPIGNRLCYKNQQTLTLLVPKIRISGPFYLRAIRWVSRKHRPQKHRPQTSKKQTSKLRVLFKTYTFDENSLRVALIFLQVLATGVPTLLFFRCLMFNYIGFGYGWTANKNRQQSNAPFFCF